MLLNGLLLANINFYQQITLGNNFITYVQTIFNSILATYILGSQVGAVTLHSPLSWQVWLAHQLRANHTYKFHPLPLAKRWKDTVSNTWTWKKKLRYCGDNYKHIVSPLLHLNRLWGLCTHTYNFVGVASHFPFGP